MRHLVAFPLLILVLAFGGCAARSARVPPPTFTDVMDVLVEDGIAQPERLRIFKRRQAVRLLKGVQLNAQGERAQQAAYLMGVLKHQRKQNRELLLHALNYCIDSDDVCAQQNALYLVDLYNRGDAGALKPLLRAGLRAQGGAADALGAFYGNLILDNPHWFLKEAERALTVDEQKVIAGVTARGVRSGTGVVRMTRAMQRDLERDLRKMSDSRKEKLRPAAATWLAELEAMPLAPTE
jgi:hypothetical protein